jgi:hypothetical protein
MNLDADDIVTMQTIAGELAVMQAKLDTIRAKLPTTEHNGTRRLSLACVIVDLEHAEAKLREIKP